MPKLKPFAYVVMILVGEGGAGPHDIVRMMQDGRWYWSGSDSQFYAEPKRLEKLGLLSSHSEPGITKARTVYQLTDKGRKALVEWLAEPSNMPRIQEEQVARLLGSEYVDDRTTIESVRPLRVRFEAELDAITRHEARIAEFPHRERPLRINLRLQRRMIEAHIAWLDEVEAEYGG